MADTLETAAAQRLPTQPLRDRLPRMQPAQARAIRSFFAAPQIWTLRDNGALRLYDGRARDNAFPVDAEGTRILLAFDEIGDAPGVDGLHWPDFQGRSRVLAWALSNEPHLMALSEALGVALLPVTDASTPKAGYDADGLWLEFTIEDGGYDDQPQVLRSSGALRIPAGWLGRLLAKADPPYDDEPLPLDRWNDLPEPVALVFAGPALRQPDWAGLRAGDVLVLGSRAHPPQVEARSASRAWPVRPGPNGWEISGEFRTLIQETSTMSDETDELDGVEGESAEPRPPTAHNLPVQVDFHLGSMQLTVGELANLQPGYVFTLPVQVEGANVDIRANGQRVGRGELVAVGDTLGVRLVSWS